jgi:septal ring factor EnvC (AmiA/AmiB activator)
VETTLTDTTVIFAAAIAAVPPTLTGLAALLLAILNRSSAQMTDTKTDSIIRKADEIHTLTNSNLAEVTKTLQVANEKISGLEKLLGAMTPQAGIDEAHRKIDALEAALANLQNQRRKKL